MAPARSSPWSHSKGPSSAEAKRCHGGPKKGSRGLHLAPQSGPGGPRDFQERGAHFNPAACGKSRHRGSPPGSVAIVRE
eukprot:4273944-Pyramimonas_sp.AAC.1